MVGAIIGVGVLGLPYAFAQSGVAIGLLFLTVVGLLLTALQLMFSEVCLQTEGKHHLVGLVNIYLGTKWRWVALVAASFGIWGAMIAYMIVGGRFLHILLSPIFGGQEFVYSILVWLIGTALIYRGLRFASKVEVPIVLVLLFLFVFIMLVCVPEIHPQNYFTFDLNKFFTPYGVVLFSMAGAGIVPEMVQLLGRRDGKKYLGLSVVIGMSIILLLYAGFSLAVVGVTGVATTEAAFDGLIPILGDSFMIVTTILGSLTILSIYLVLGIEMLDVFKIDFHLKHKTAWLILSLVPIVLFLLGVREFISLVSFIGGVFGGTLGILIALTYWKMKHKITLSHNHCINFPSFLTWAIIVLFSGGLIFEISSAVLGAF